MRVVAAAGENSDDTNATWDAGGNGIDELSFGKDDGMEADVVGDLVVVRACDGLVSYHDGFVEGLAIIQADMIEVNGQFSTTDVEWLFVGD